MGVPIPRTYFCGSQGKAKLLLMSSEGLFNVLAFSDVGRYTAGRVGCAGVITKRKLDREIRVQPIIVWRLFFIIHRTVSCQNLQIVCAERVRNLLWKNFVIRMADNLFGREMK